MKRKRIIILISFILLLGGVLSFVNYVDTKLSGFDPKKDIHFVSFDSVEEGVYIVAKAWGIGANHNEIYISLNKISEKNDCDGVECYLLYATELFYRKASEDTLIVYVAASIVGKELHVSLGGVKIVLNELDSYDDLMDMEKNHESYGLKRVSVYDIKTSVPTLPDAM